MCACAFFLKKKILKKKKKKTGSRVSVEEIELYTIISVHNRPALCGFLGPGSQGRVEAPVQGFVGGATPMA